MWLIDISDRAYSKDANGYRQFFVVQKELQDENRERWLYKRKRDRFKYFVAEEWRTPNSTGDTRGFEHYEFATYQEACIFIADLIVKLNSLHQNALIQAAREITDEIIKLSPDKLNRLVCELYAHEAERRKQQCAEVERRQKQERERRQKQERERQQKQKQQEAERRQRQWGAFRQHQQQSKIPDPNQKSVYIFDMGNGTVKIGVSVNVEQRATAIENSSGLTITRRCHTEPMPTKLSLLIESKCHTHFAEHRAKGEFFRVSYEDAQAYLSTHASKLREICPCKPPQSPITG